MIFPSVNKKSSVHQTKGDEGGKSPSSPTLNEDICHEERKSHEWK